ncbi:MAG: AraC family transcriptional regulator, partial [Acidimicrobiia bacterium]|nr:AraC family transcriptional regulator [Acidimicrobiia bacterium]
DQPPQERTNPQARRQRKAPQSGRGQRLPPPAPIGLNLDAFALVLRALGYEVRPILASAGIAAAILEDPDERVPMSAGIGPLNHAEEVTGDSDIGLHLAEHADLGTFDVHFYAMLSSPTLTDAYERLCRYQRLIHETTEVTLDLEGKGATLRHRLPGGMAVPRHSAEFIVAAWVRAGRVVTETPWAPKKMTR